MKKLLLTFLLFIIGFSSFALELTCEWQENKYLKLFDKNYHVKKTINTDEDLGDFRISILDDECIKIKDTNLKISKYKATKTDSRYTCQRGFDKKRDDEWSIFVREIIHIDRYTRKAERVWYDKVLETKSIYRCEKWEKKF